MKLRMVETIMTRARFDLLTTVSGLTSVEKFYGREAAERTAADMEHQRTSAEDEQPTGVRPTQRP